MKRFLIILPILLLVLCGFTEVHKFYVSVTQVAYSESDEALQITSRIFIDDLDNVLRERYAIRPKLATTGELEKADEFIEKYLRSKFVVQVNGQATPFDFLGKRYDRDIAVCYLEIKNIPAETLHSIEIQNEILTDLFEEQKNIVHLEVQGQKRSYVLVRENNKAMLNL